MNRRSSQDDHAPIQGYVGSSSLRSGRQIPIPEHIYNLINIKDTLYFGYHPAQLFPVFAPLKNCLKESERQSEGWPYVGKNPVRIDNDTPVVQLPARFFPDFSGPTKMNLLDSVPEKVQLKDGQKLHFVIGWQPHCESFVCFLITTPELAELEVDLFSRLFPTPEQRSKIIAALDEEDMLNHERHITLLFDRISESIKNN